MATGPNPRIAAVKDWVGVSAPFVPRQEAVAGAAPNAPARPAPDRRALRWPPGRLAAVEALWGDRFNGPVGEAETIRLAGPLALGPEDKLLLIGGGLGGPACAVAADRGAFVANFEADAELASLARLRVQAHRCAERVVIEGWNPDYPDFGIRACDHAMLLEALRAGDAMRTLESLAASLRPRSRIVMTEMVTDRPSPGSDREFAAWCRLENRHAGLPRGDAITTALRRLHYDVREVEDISSTHVTAVLAGWRNAVKTMDEAPVPSAASASVVVTEAELWLLRIRVMRRFGFRLLRWHAIGTAGRAVGAAAG